MDNNSNAVRGGIVVRYRSKRYRKSLEKYDCQKKYSVEEAADIVRKMEPPKFVETVQVAVLLGLDARRQQIRGAFSLPNGIGKEKKVIVFAEGDQAKEAEAAGALEVGGQDLVKKVADGWTDFDVAVAHPAMMRFVGRLGKVLGPQGKMPTPKSGTVTEHVGDAVREFRAGKIEFRNDKGGNVHAPVGKLDFPSEKLAGNITAFLDHLKSLKPPQTKGTFIQRASLSSTMSPGIKLIIH